MNSPATTPQAWLGLRRKTSARIALGRSGGSMPSKALIDFKVAHAAARDAVLAPFSPEKLVERIQALDITCAQLRSAARDRQEYLLRPDLGRRLSEDSSSQLRRIADAHPRPDIAILCSDGLSSLAAERQVLPVLKILIPALRSAGYAVEPVLVVPLARVKLQDEVGAALGARLSLMLLGERPGLGTPDSLGAYFTWKPSAERTDADRNCLSNIRPGGLDPADAAMKLNRLIRESLRQRLSGVRLKDMGDATGSPLPLGEQ
jgi:ethanolamine ammonia-lyase small subunit